jgi:very-short-patch-repair endonuclease
MDLHELLTWQDGVAAKWQLLAHMSTKAMLHRTMTGRWRRVHRSIFVTHSGPLTDRQRRWVAVLTASTPDALGCLAGLSALQAWGLRGIDGQAIDVLVPHPRRIVTPRGVRAHRTRLPPDLDGGRHLRPPATMPSRSLVDATQWARTEQEARLIIAASFQQRLLTFVDVQREVAAMPNARRRGLLLRTAEDCAGGSHSLAELDLLDLCRRHRLPTPTRQQSRVDLQGRRRFLDAVFDPWKVAVEIDGTHHLEVGQMWDDARRANSLELDGYVLLRYPAFAVRTEPARIAAEIRQALTKAGWVGSGPS